MPCFAGYDFAREAIKKASSSLYLQTNNPDDLSLVLEKVSKYASVYIVISIEAARRSHGDDLKRLVKRGAEIWVKEGFGPHKTIAVADEKYIGDDKKGIFIEDKSIARDYISDWRTSRMGTLPCRSSK
jgi:hypothetical protein